MKTIPFPCPFCDGGEFIRAEPIVIQWLVNNVAVQNNRFTGTALVCTGCGRMELFMKEPRAWSDRVAKAPGLGASPLSVVRADKPG
jgi:predicted nucleic-acid-binding Zn-ribbon protein